ncbi:hypothetical protein GGI07_002323 [Coemansia sp. Benny D115]|nr:hypothetical protein GGI07_002323 [Coemansia sp. Benny D115]
MSELLALDKLPPLHGDDRIAFIRKITNSTVDDNDKTDTVAIAFSILALALTSLFLGFVWLNRSYRPLRAKTIKMCTMMHIASIFWVIGDFQMNGLVRIEGAWKNCRFWVVWVRILFSFIYSSLVMIRFYALHHIFIRGKPYRGMAVWLPAVALAIILLAYCLVCQLLPVEHIVFYIKYAQICVVDDRYRYVSVGLIWVPWLVVLVLAIRIRQIQTSFNELYESLFTCCLGFLILIKTTIVHAVHPYYVFTKSFRQSETLIDAYATNLIVWIMLGYPVYQCIFRREAYDREWARKLRTDGLANKYSAEINSSPNETTSYSRMEDSMYDNTKMGGKSYYDKDPLDTIRMLSQNGGGTLISNSLNTPTNVYRSPMPDLNFSSLSPNSLDSFDTNTDPPNEYPRQII